MEQWACNRGKEEGCSLLCGAPACCCQALPASRDCKLHPQRAKMNAMDSMEIVQNPMDKGGSLSPCIFHTFRRMWKVSQVVDLCWHTGSTRIVGSWVLRWCTVYQYIHVSTHQYVAAGNCWVQNNLHQDLCDCWSVHVTYDRYTILSRSGLQDLNIYDELKFCVKF